jgi:N-acetylglucosaminyl-diphospho-decaprenol L-rhamnosyltransferase
VTEFAIVTVTHNSEPDLGRLLDSIERELPERPQVIVVDSGSSDGSAALAADRGAEVVELMLNAGFGEGCNVGVERARRPVTALVNPDVELLDSGLAELARRAQAEEAILAPRLLNPDGTTQDSAHPRPGRLDDLVPALLPRPLLPPVLRRRYEPWRSPRARRVGWVTAACVVARTDLLRHLGPFDERAFLFYEDMELCLAAAREGVPTILHPDVAVRHLGGTSTGRTLAADEDLELRARRRREVVAREGRVRLALDDAAQAATFATRAAVRSLTRRGGDYERGQLRAWREARRAGVTPGGGEAAGERQR